MGESYERSIQQNRPFQNANLLGERSPYALLKEPQPDNQLNLDKWTLVRADQTSSLSKRMPKVTD